MATDELLVVELAIDGGETALVVDGELDVSTAPVIEERLSASAGAAGVRRIVMDLRGVSFCDGAGLHALARCRQSASLAGLGYVVKPSTAVRRIADVADYGIALDGLG